ncbi:hypothetical protein V4C85_21750 [Ralstonia solanacearum]|uniref:hypothetical protein n=1 Tax=Ralstonia solanacearum TaxID=305 RepID=UPI0012DAAD3E|nr:hypothetical protein [Ralstonia solanacearum]
MKRINSSVNNTAPNLGSSQQQSDSSSGPSRQRRKTSAPESIRQALPKRLDRASANPQQPSIVNNPYPWIVESTPASQLETQHSASQPPAHTPPDHQQSNPLPANFFDNLDQWIPANAPPVDWDAIAKSKRNDHS